MPLIRMMDRMNLYPELLTRASPVLEPTVNPENETAPAEAPLVNKISIPQSEVGAVIVMAELIVAYWN